MTRDSDNTVTLSRLDYLRVGILVFGAVASVIGVAWNFTSGIETKNAVMQTKIETLQTEVKRLSDRLDRLIEKR